MMDNNKDRNQENPPKEIPPREDPEKNIPIKDPLPSDRITEINEKNV